MAGGSPDTKKYLYAFTRIRCKAAGILNRLGGNNLLLAERTQGRAFDELLKEAKKIKADWYIGHNLGSLPVAEKAAKYHYAKAGFDLPEAADRVRGPRFGDRMWVGRVRSRVFRR